MKKIITKDEIIEDITSKNIWDVNKSFAYEATKNFSFEKTPRHSKQHYELIYCIAKSKIETMTSQTEQIAYLDCLLLNYKDLKNTDIFDVLISLFSGGAIGVSFSKITGLRIFIMSICFVLFAIKVLVMLTRRWAFYQMIIDQLKKDISKNP